MGGNLAPNSPNCPSGQKGQKGQKPGNLPLPSPSPYREGERGNRDAAKKGKVIHKKVSSY
jgi:hypothetical protein